MKILEALCHDKIHFYQRRPSETPEALRLKKQISAETDELTKMLSSDAVQLFEKLMDHQGELSSLTECDNFIYGFRLGAKIILEATDETTYNP